MLRGRHSAAGARGATPRRSVRAVPLTSPPALRVRRRMLTIPPARRWLARLVPATPRGFRRHFARSLVQRHGQERLAPPQPAPLQAGRERGAEVRPTELPRWHPSSSRTPAAAPPLPPAEQTHGKRSRAAATTSSATGATSSGLSPVPTTESRCCSIHDGAQRPAALGL